MKDEKNMKIENKDPNELDEQLQEQVSGGSPLWNMESGFDDNGGLEAKIKHPRGEIKHPMAKIKHPINN